RRHAHAAGPCPTHDDYRSATPSWSSSLKALNEFWMLFSICERFDSFRGSSRAPLDVNQVLGSTLRVRLLPSFSTRLPSNFCSVLTAVVKVKSAPSMVPSAMIEALA